MVNLTTSQAAEDVLRAYGLHATSHITKPVDLELLLTVARKIKDFWLAVVTFPADIA